MPVATVMGVGDAVAREVLVSERKAIWVSSISQIFRGPMPRHSQGVEVSTQSFADLGVSSAVARALSGRGITAPFPVQTAVIPDVLAGRDVLVRSPTGSGKTLAFGLPLVDRIEADDPRCAALVLVPTRELAAQIVRSCASRRTPVPSWSRPCTAASASRSRRSSPAARTSWWRPRAGSRT